MLRVGLSRRRLGSSLNLPALDLNYAGAGALYAAETFTRSSVADRFNSSGSLEAIASGLPRFDFDPVSHASLGLRIEESRTNLALQSNAFSTTWAAQTVAVTSGAGTGPDGTNSLWKLAESGTGVQTPQVQQSLTTSAVAYTLSVFAKAAERSWLRLNLFDGTADNQGWFNLSSGTVGTLGSGVTASVQSVGNGIYRCAITKTLPAATTTYVIAVANADNTKSYTITAGSGILIYGAQLEQAALASTYIPTTSAAATRAADADSLALSAVGLPANPSALTIIGKARTASGFAASQTLIDLSDAGSTNRFRLYRTTGRTVFANVKVANVDVFNGAVIASLPDDTDFAFWFAAQANDYAAQLIGQTKQTASSGGMPTGLGTAYIGNNPAGSATWDGTIARLQIFTRRLSDTEAAARAAAL